MFEICEDCHHSMSMHMGVVDMGGGHSEPLGCTHTVDYEKQILCDCLKYEEGWDE